MLQIVFNGKYVDKYDCNVKLKYKSEEVDNLVKAAASYSRERGVQTSDIKDWIGPSLESLMQIYISPSTEGPSYSTGLYLISPGKNWREDIIARLGNELGKALISDIETMTAKKLTEVVQDLPKSTDTPKIASQITRKFVSRMQVEYQLKFNSDPFDSTEIIQIGPDAMFNAYCKEAIIHYDGGIFNIDLQVLNSGKSNFFLEITQRIKSPVLNLHSDFSTLYNEEIRPFLNKLKNDHNRKINDSIKKENVFARTYQDKDITYHIEVNVDWKNPFYVDTVYGAYSPIKQFTIKVIVDEWLTAKYSRNFNEVHYPSGAKELAREILGECFNPWKVDVDDIQSILIAFAKDLFDAQPSKPGANKVSESTVSLLKQMYDIEKEWAAKSNLRRQLLDDFVKYPVRGAERLEKRIEELAEDILELRGQYENTYKKLLEKLSK